MYDVWSVYKCNKCKKCILHLYIKQIMLGIVKGGNKMKVYINNVLATAEDWNYLYVLISQNKQRIVSIHYADKGVMITTEE